MRSVKAVFKKQAKDTIRDVSMLAQFLIFPAVAFAMTELVARGEMFAEFGWPRMCVSLPAAMGGLPLDTLVPRPTWRH